MEKKFNFAKQIVLNVASYIKEHLDDQLEIETKSSPTDLVTQMDKEVQNNLVTWILEAYPTDHILAEENGLRHSISDGNVWVIDPIDGTNNFVAQKADFAVVLAYFENGIGQFGVIYDVIGDKLYHGGGQFDVYCNEQKLPSYQDRPLNQFLMASNAGIFERNDWGIADLAKETLGVRVYGSAAISFSKVLSGQLLTYISYICPWDYAAASIMGDKLGYTTLTFAGEQPDFKSRQGIMMIPTMKLDEIKKYIYRK